jgi:CRISPR/Cas system Type II protein with McrA/HNH and RuvC-like nuclease domain
MPKPLLNTIKSRDLLSLVERQGMRCAYSGRALSPETASIDHIIPVSRGGSLAIDNLAVVDGQVNAAKGTLSLDEFVQMCRDVTAHADAAAGANGQPIV